MATAEQGWQALNQGNYELAEDVFTRQLSTDPRNVVALTGLGRTLVLRGRHAEAQTVVAQAMEVQQTPELDALMGEIVGRQGRRQEAERLLDRAVARRPDVPYYWAVLAEQRLRQGRWKEGTETYVRAMQNDADGRAFNQLRELLTDMVDAVIAGRIPENDAMRFINQLDYTIPNRTPEMSSFFGLARRSINARQPIGSATAPSRVQRTAPQPAQPQQPAQVQRTAQPQRAPQTQQPVQTQRSSQVQQPARTPRQAPIQQSADQIRSTTRSRQSRDNREIHTRHSQAQQQLLARSTDVRMLEILQQERSLNEALQNGVPEAIPPTWPSLMKNPIDTIAPIGFSTRNILGNESGIRTNDFRLTGGDLLVEIVLERCLHNLIAATVASKPNTLAFTPSNILRLELNCRDGLFEHMPPLEDLYREEVSVENQRLLAFGEFIGDCLVRTFGGVWQYDNPPERSTLFLGNQVLKPFDYVSRWLTDPEGTDFSVLIKESEAALAKSSAMPNFVDYIDPTPGLGGVALRTMLAELWTAYRFSLSETAYSEIGSTMTLVSQDTQTVLFTLDKAWVPGFGHGDRESAVDRDDQISMAYVRKTGQFLLLGTPKHFAQFAGMSFKRLGHDNVSEVVALIQRHFCPRWRLVSSQAMVQEASTRLNNPQISAPKITPTSEGAVLELWVITNRHAAKITLTHASNHPSPWQLRVN